MFMAKKSRDLHCIGQSRKCGEDLHQDRPRPLGQVRLHSLLRTLPPRPCLAQLYRPLAQRVVSGVAADDQRRRQRADEVAGDDHEYGGNHSDNGTSPPLTGILALDRAEC